MSQPKCPLCDRLVEDKAYKPFCSKRCADVDLSRWLKGSYAIPGRSTDEGDGLPGNDPSSEQ